MGNNNFNQRDFIKTSGLGALALNTSFILTSCQTSVAAKEKLNVLFIAVDDLRPELGCYGNTDIIAPNIDKLARDGYLFNNAFCKVSVCGASRASLLSGLRPNRDRFINYDSWVEKDSPGITTLPKHFKDSGYHTISNGKIFHHRPDCKKCAVCIHT